MASTSSSGPSTAPAATATCATCAASGVEGRPRRIIRTYIRSSYYIRSCLLYIRIIHTYNTYVLYARIIRTYILRSGLLCEGNTDCEDARGAPTSFLPFHRSRRAGQAGAPLPTAVFKRQLRTGPERARLRATTQEIRNKK